MINGVTRATLKKEARNVLKRANACVNAYNAKIVIKKSVLSWLMFLIT